MIADVMKERSFQNLVSTLNGCTGYLLSASILNSDGRLEHILLMENFPKGDILASLVGIKELAIKELEIPTPRVVDFKVPENLKLIPKVVDGIRSEDSE